jgi:hypothetical protein
MKRTTLILIILLCSYNSTKAQKTDLRPTGELLIDNESFFFDDFNILPKHSQGNAVSNKFKYSLYSIINDKSIAIEDGLLKLTLFSGQRHKTANGFRAELVLKTGNINNDEQWFEWSFMIPKSYKIDPSNVGKEVSIAQFHSIRNKNAEPKLFNRPSVQFLYLEQYGKNILLLRYGQNGEPGEKFENKKWQIIALNDSIEKGQWYQIRLNIKWSKSNTGYIATWLNNKPFTPFNGVDNRVYGANMHNDRQSYLKIGYYRYWDNSTPTEIFYDYIKTAQSFEELTGKRPSSIILYNTVNDYGYLRRKVRVLSEIVKKKE